MYTDERRKPLRAEEKEDAPSRRLGGFRRDNFRAGKTRALCCKHNVASCRFLLWRVSRETSFVPWTRKRERQREKKGGKSAHKIRIFFPSDFLSLSFFSQTLNTWDIFFSKVKREEKKSCHDGWNTTSVVECVQKRAKKQRKVDATTTCRDDPSSLEKKRRGEKTQGKEEGEEHEKARE